MLKIASEKKILKVGFWHQASAVPGCNPSLLPL